MYIRKNAIKIGSPCSFLRNIHGFYSNFATDEVVIPYYLTSLMSRIERSYKWGTRNSRKSAYWINLLDKLNIIDPEHVS